MDFVISRKKKKKKENQHNDRVGNSLIEHPQWFDTSSNWNSVAMNIRLIEWVNEWMSDVFKYDARHLVYHQ